MPVGANIIEIEEMQYVTVMRPMLFRMCVLDTSRFTFAHEMEASKAYPFKKER